MRQWESANRQVEPRPGRQAQPGLTHSRALSRGLYCSPSWALGKAAKAARPHNTGVGQPVPPKNLLQALGLSIRRGVSLTPAKTHAARHQTPWTSGKLPAMFHGGPPHLWAEMRAAHSSPALPSPPVSSVRHAGVRSRRAPRSVYAGGAAGPSGPGKKVDQGLALPVL